MSLDRILQATVKAGGQEVRLVPGRRIVILTPAGEREVQGPEQTPSTIDQLLAPLLTADAREALAGGRAEWGLDVPGVGPVRARAERRPDGTFASFAVGNAARPAAAPAPAAVTAPAPAAVPPAAPRGSGPAAEIEELFRVMVDMKASDLHISVGSPPMVRHDGDVKALPGRAVLAPADTERMLWPIAPERNREEFKRRHDTDFAYEIPGLARFRCNFFVDRKGMGGVFRVIPSRIMTAEEMGLPKEILQLCHLPKGLVLVTGPTGSGKSTTLCALIDYINRNRTDHIITVEDPLEFVHENKKCLINQRQVGEHTDSFKDALRAALREDPDIVLVGEMRDLETVAIAIETAETGHLVFGTLHTSSAPSTVDRIIDQFPADRQSQVRVMLAESLKGVVSQMLCKKIGGGRVPVLEVLIVTPSVSNLIREAKIFQIPSIMQTGKKYGMCMMNEAFTDLVKKKVIEPQEAHAKATDKSGLLAMFKKAGIDTSWAPTEASPGAPGPSGS
ncbi:MAG TPA: type IV pilus twitching motility protein PilT [Vicinamibacteria bacterium]